MLHQGTREHVLTVKDPFSLSDQQSHRSCVNDNYCVSCGVGNVVSLCVCVTGTWTCIANCVTGNNSSGCVTGNQDCFITTKDTVGTLTVNFCSVVNPGHFATRSPQKARHNSQLLLSVSRIKHVKDVSCLD